MEMKENGQYSPDDLYNLLLVQFVAACVPIDWTTAAAVVEYVWRGIRAFKVAVRLCAALKLTEKLAATLRGSRPGVQSASLIMTSLITS